MLKPAIEDLIKSKLNISNNGQIIKTQNSESVSDHSHRKFDISILRSDPNYQDHTSNNIEYKEIDLLEELQQEINRVASTTDIVQTNDSILLNTESRRKSEQPNQQNPKIITN